MAIEFTARQQEIMAQYMMCMRTKPDVDMEKFAKVGGFANVASARACIHKILQKILSAADDVDAGDTTANADGKKKKSPRKRKGAEEDDEETDKTPKKKVAGAKKAGKKAADIDQEQENEAIVKTGDAGDDADDAEH